jgi:molybdopterin-dependent oxidoreductase alpha subunit
VTKKAHVAPEPPHEPSPPLVTTQPHDAGGFGAIAATLKHAREELGPGRTMRALRLLNQERGFDCPGCAWPEPERRSAFEFCENGAKAIAEEATRKRVGADDLAEWPMDRLAEQSDHFIGKLGRITQPLMRRKGESCFSAIDWDDAFALVGKALRGLASPDEATFYTSGRTSNEAAFLYQLFVRQLGTNNLPDCSNMCHESSGAGLGESIGVGKGTVTLEDFEHADAIFVIGQNPGTNHPRMLTTLGEARARGATIVAVNPLAEAGLTAFRHPQDPTSIVGPAPKIASLTLRVRINGDVALLKGIMKEMLEEESRAEGSVVDWDFVRHHTSGFQAFRDALAREEWSALVRESGVSREAIRAAARVAIESKRMIVCWAMGLTQHKNGVGNVQEVVNFALLRGQIGRRGAGLCPVRGHSNVQGDRTMGIWEKMPDEFLDALGAEFDFAPPRAHGMDVTQSIRAMRDGRVKVFVSMGGNFLSASPDTHVTADALAKCELAVSVSTKLNRTHLVAGEAALILPCLGRSERDLTGGKEQFVTVEDSMSMVHGSHGALEPASPQLKSEVAIVAGIAKAALGERSRVPWDELANDYDAIREHIARVVPGFHDFNARVRRGAFHLPNAAGAREFRTSDKKAQFHVVPLPAHELRRDELLMMTIRSHDQYNTTIYGLDDRYRGIRNGRRVVFVNEEDLRARGIAPQTLVDIVGRHGEERRVAEAFWVVAYDIARGCCATYYPEANSLVPLDAVADKSGTPASKSVIVSLRRRT